MADYVFLVEMKDYEKLKKLLETDPYAGDSFGRLGYTLRDSKAAGLKGGSYVLHFRCEEKEAAKYKERLKTVESLKEMEGSEKESVVKSLEESENSATAGFGSIFG